MHDPRILVFIQNNIMLSVICINLIDWYFLELVCEIRMMKHVDNSDINTNIIVWNIETIDIQRDGGQILTVLFVYITVFIINDMAHYSTVYIVVCSLRMLMMMKTHLIVRNTPILRPRISRTSSMVLQRITLLLLSLTHIYMYHHYLLQ